MQRPLPIALTCGDPAGIGPELVARILREEPAWGERVCPIGPPEWLEAIGFKGLPCAGPLDPGNPSEAGARCAWAALEAAAQGCRAGRFSAVVTGPVSKEQLKQVGFPFPGQTEFFAHAWAGMPSMAFAGRELKVVLATWHEPLAAIPARFRKSPELLDRAVLRAHEWMRKEGHREPRVAVCGLNPHAGEAGLLGSEEHDVLDPRLEVLRSLYPGLSRCLPADTVFHRLREGEFDVAVALYHDQGLIPVKTLEFHSAVNLTLGLDFLRTSPDHGTAFALAGKDLARTGSFRNALELAWRSVSRQRKG